VDLLLRSHLRIGSPMRQLEASRNGKAARLDKISQMVIETEKPVDATPFLLDLSSLSVHGA